MPRLTLLLRKYTVNNPQDMIDRKTCRQFLELLFGHELIEDFYLNIFLIHPTELRVEGDRSQGMKTQANFFKVTDTDSIIDFVFKVRDEWQVYVGINVFKEKIEKGRGKLSDIAAVTSFFADVDVENTMRQSKKKYAKSKAQAQTIIEQVGLKPSIILDSGYGLQGYWIFKEPWVIENVIERTELHTKSKAWGQTVNSVAKMHGAQVDPANDITRVFRLPGTYNLKDPEDPKPVKFIVQPKDEVVTYLLEDFDLYYVEVDLKVPINHKEIGEIPPVIPNKHFSEADLELMKACCETKAGLAATWAGKNKSLEDQSASSYDLSLASHLVDLEMEPQFIASAMYTLRQRMGWNTDKIVSRRDYVQRTIATAMRNDASVRAVVAINRQELKIQRSTPADIMRVAQEANDGDEQAGVEAMANAKQEAIDFLSAALEVKIIRFIKMGTVDATYFMEMQHLGKTISCEIGEATAMNTCTKIRRRIFEATNYWIREIKGASWRAVANTIGSVLDLEENYDGEPIEFIGGVILEMFSGEHGIGKGENWIEAVKSHAPFMNEDKIGVYGPTLLRFIHQYYDGRMTRKDLGKLLRSAGFRSQKIDKRDDDDGRVQATYWLGPINILGNLAKEMREKKDETSEVADDVKQRASGD